MKVMGLALVAVFLLGAVGASSASASQPKFETAEGFPVTFTGASTEAPSLQTTVFGFSATVTCEKDESKGEINGATTVKKVFVTYKGCKDSTGGTCTTSPDAAGTILTKELKGETVYYVEGATQGAGILFEPTSGSSFAEFTCSGGFLGAFTNSVTGKVIGKPAPVNAAPSKSGTLTFTRSGTTQLPSEYKLPSGCTTDSAKLADSINGGGSSAAAVKGKESVTFSKAVKLTSSPPCV